jgi:hypothetical protein
MQILDSYLRAVKRYLPRAQSEDIIKELSDDLRSQLDDKQAELGRPLTDAEAMAFFKAHGDPMTVARRYRQDHRSLSLGWELIGPELFPMYLIFLAFNLAITIVSVIVICLLVHAPISAQTFVVPVLSQIVCLTFVFTMLNMIRRKFPQPWYYPPAELAPMIPVSRWYSLAGLIMWVAVAAWWLALPHFPRLIIGSAANMLKLAPSWHRFYVPMLLLILASIAQRVLNLIYPAKAWLIPVMRGVINVAGVVVLYFLFFKNDTLFVLADGISSSPQSRQLIQNTNGLLRWGLLGPWLWIYAGVSAIVYAWYCVPHVRRLFRKTNEQSAPSV